MLSLRRFSPGLRRLSSSGAGFYEVLMETPTFPATVRGRVINNEIAFDKLRPRDRVDVPYEVTVGASVRDFWQSAFYSHDRVNTSAPFANALGFEDALLPFGLLLFLTGSMSHADAAKVQIAYSNARYCLPAYAGDTFTKHFVVKQVRNTSDKEHSIITFACELRNQHGKPVFTCDKKMLFPFARSLDVVGEYNPPVPPDALVSAMTARAGVLGQLGSQSLQPLRPGQLLLHSLHRPLTDTQSRQLSSLARLTHERHFDSVRFPDDHLRYIPGGLIVGLALSASARDLHEVLHESMRSCSFIRNVHPGESVGAVSFVTRLEENVGGDLEAVTVRTIGVKNMDVRDLTGVDLPTELFTRPGLQRATIDEILGDEHRALAERIVVALDRRMLRQAPRHEVFLL